MDPHFLNGMLDFPAGLQTSRPRTDVWRTLGAEKVVSGNPPAIFVQVIIGRATAKAGDGMGASAPMFLFCRFFGIPASEFLCTQTFFAAILPYISGLFLTIYRFLTNLLLETNREIDYNERVCSYLFIFDRNKEQ